MRTGRIFALLVFFLLLAALSLALAVTISPSRQLDLIQNAYDPRLEGFKEAAALKGVFNFTEPVVAAPSANLILIYGKERVTINAGGGLLSGISTAVPSVSESGRDLTGIEIEPRFLLLWPAGKSCAGAIILAALLIFLVYAAFQLPSRLRLLPPAAAALLLGLFLGQNRYAYFPRGIWLWIFLCALCLGVLLYRYLRLRVSERPSLAAPIVPLLVGILVLGFFLRFNGLGFGLPGLFHPDESRKIKIARGIVETGDLNPHYFRHPTFLLYATAFNTWVYSKVTGELPETATVAYLGRSVSAVLGGLSILILFLIGRLIYSPAAGLIAASFLAVSPLHVVSSRYIKEDSALLFFTLVSFYFAVRALKERCSMKYTLLSALTAGFSASSKYSGLLNLGWSFLPLYEMVAAKLNWKALRFTAEALPFKPGKIFITALIIPVCFTAGFLLLSPYALLDHELFLYDFLGEKQHMERGHTVPITAMSYYWGFHIKRSLLPPFQVVFGFLSFIAAGFLAGRRKMFDLLIIGAAFLFYLPSEYVNAKPEPQPERYVLPCIPFLALAAGEMLSLLFRNQKVRLTAVALCAAAFMQSLHYSFLHGLSIKTDTRIQARDWILENIPRGSKIIMDWRFYGPPNLADDYNVLELKDKSAAKLARGISAEAVNATGYDYLVLSSFSYGRFLMTEYRAHNLSSRYKTLFSEMTPLKEFNNEEFAYGFHNPEIKIFKLQSP